MWMNSADFQHVKCWKSAASGFPAFSGAASGGIGYAQMTGFQAFADFRYLLFPCVEIGINVAST
jgi:hypothetical protein